MGHKKTNYRDGVRPKKHLGQHFLIDLNAAEKIASALRSEPCKNLVEIGPGTGVLSNFLKSKLSDSELRYFLVELDLESVEFLNSKEDYRIKGLEIIHKDVLQMDWNFFGNDISLIGNLPYNISSPIFFKILEYHALIKEGVFMIQREVAERICSSHGSKTYGILSVLLQVYFDCELLFNVGPEAFNPPPKVHSTVIRLTKKQEIPSDSVFPYLKAIVKKSFNQRRKMFRNTLKSEMEVLGEDYQKFLTLRPEQVSVSDYLGMAIALHNK